MKAIQGYAGLSVGHRSKFRSWEFQHLRNTYRQYLVGKLDDVIRFVATHTSEFVYTFILTRVAQLERSRCNRISVQR